MKNTKNKKRRSHTSKLNSVLNFIPEPKTKNSELKKPFRKNASVIARKNEKFLLVKKPRKQHAWQFPQGGVEKNESFAEAALREFTEEVGASEIKISQEVGTYFYDWSDEKEVSGALQKFRGQEVHFFVADFLAEDAVIKLDTNELEEWKWVNVAEIKNLIESKEYLAKILEIIDAN